MFLPLIPPDVMFFQAREARTAVHPQDCRILRWLAASSGDEPQCPRTARRLGPGVTIELREDVANEHVDRAWAEKELSCDLSVRSPDGDETHPLELAAREAASLQIAGGSASSG